MGTQQNESSFAGKPLVTTNPRAAGNLLFQEVTSEVKTMLFADPEKPKSVFISTAGQTDFSIRASRDSLDAHAKNVAVWAAAQVYSARDGNLFLGDLPAGITALEVTAVKTAASPADDAAEVTAIGGRVEVRAFTIEAVTSGETAAAALTGLTEMAID
jgi:hypothetical protein